MRVALAQINPTLASFKKNKEKIIENIISLSQKKAELIVFPEASLFGYHPFDLLEREELVVEQLKAVKEIIKKIPPNVYVLIGCFTQNKEKRGRPFYNSALLCTKNKIIKQFNKTLLPTGDVFDEARFIEPGNLESNYFKIKNKTFFLTICEDFWAWDKSGKVAKPSQNIYKKISEYKENPLKKVKKKKTDLVINMSASPYHITKLALRQYMAQKTSEFFKAPVMYVNMVGAQDEVIYDGQSFVINSKGNLLLQAQGFVEDSNLFDLTTHAPWSPSAHKESSIELLRKALILGIQDFTKKIGVTKVHLGLSGGIDSAIVACLAVDALGSQNVKLFALPTEYNKPESFSVAKQLADNLGVKLQTISIQETFTQMKNFLDMQFEVKEFCLMHENLQSRIRGLFMMAYSNFTGSMLLTTGNKDEYATGYATLYGDMCGGLAPIGDLTKKQVVELCRLYNKEVEVIPEFIITRPPSAELRPNQKDQDSLPPYEVLDKAVENVVQNTGVAKSETEKWLVKQLMKTEFKRWQAPPILKVSPHAFGRGRRYPIAHQGWY